MAFAAVIGFLGNELAALVRIRTGRQIGSAALVADGLHARIDGLTSLAVLAGTIGVWLGFPLADPIIGALIGVAILFIVRDAARTMWRRLMDAVDPALVEEMAHTAGHVEGVHSVHDVRLRWIGHALWGELHIEVDGQRPTVESHAVAEEVRHALYHALPRLREITVHVDPYAPESGDPTAFHAVTAHHRVIAPEITPASRRCEEAPEFKPQLVSWPGTHPRQSDYPIERSLLHEKTHFVRLVPAGGFACPGDPGGRLRTDPGRPGPAAGSRREAG